MEFLYFPGCYLSYDPRAKKIAAATVKILNKAGVDFGILGTKESCCGESIRKTGNEAAVQAPRQENIQTFIDHGVKKILVSSPHCYHTFKNEYPGVHGALRSGSHLAVPVRADAEGRLKLRPGIREEGHLSRSLLPGPAQRRLRRAARRAEEACPALQLNEMPESRKNSFCCGGGGGRIWMETPKGERFSDLRLEQAVDTGRRGAGDLLPVLHHQLRRQQAEPGRRRQRSR